MRTSQEIRVLIQEYSNIVDDRNCIVRCNFIVDVGGFTVGADANGYLKLEFKYYPTQWTKKAAVEIAEKLKDNKPVIHSAKAWYEKALDLYKKILPDYEKMEALGLLVDKK